MVSEAAGAQRCGQLANALLVNGQAHRHWLRAAGKLSGRCRPIAPLGATISSMRSTSR